MSYYNKQKQPRTPLHFAVFFSIFGLALFIWQSYETIPYLTVKNWNQTNAQIISIRSNGARGGIAIEYKYIIDDTPHLSYKAHIASTLSIEEYNQFIQNQRNGEEITIHYDSENTSRSVIYPNMFDSDYKQILFISLCFLIPFTFVLYLYKKWTLQIFHESVGGAFFTAGLVSLLLLNLGAKSTSIIPIILLVTGHMMCQTYKNKNKG